MYTYIEKTILRLSTTWSYNIFQFPFVPILLPSFFTKNKNSIRYVFRKLSYCLQDCQAMRFETGNFLYLFLAENSWPLKLEQNFSSALMLCIERFMSDNVTQNKFSHQVVTQIVKINNSCRSNPYSYKVPEIKEAPLPLKNMTTSDFCVWNSRCFMQNYYFEGCTGSQENQWHEHRRYWSIDEYSRKQSERPHHWRIKVSDIMIQKAIMTRTRPCRVKGLKKRPFLRFLLLSVSARCRRFLILIMV